MPILADIAQLEEAVSELLASVGRRTPADDRLRTAVAEAIIALLDEKGYTAEQLLEPEVQAEILEALEKVFADWTPQLRQQVADAVTEIARLVEGFYTGRVNTAGLRLAAERAQLTQALTQALEEGMRNLRQQLAAATVEKMQDAILAGDVDRVQLAAEIEKETGTSAHFARTQAQAAVGGLNQVHRNLIAQRGGLDHWHYYGTLIVNSRPFCRIHIGWVYPTRRVEQMRNGMLEPVMVFKGGFNCRHSWLPVNPEWDDELAARVVDEEPTTIALPGKTKIVVVASQDRVARLKLQMVMQRAGYIHFIDAESNGTGFVALHEDWWSARFQARAGTKRRQAFEDDLEEAQRRAEAGEVVKLTVPEEE